MDKSQAKDLFQLQSELVQVKVDMAVNNAIDRVLDSIADLKGDIKGDINHLEKRFTSLEHRVKSTKATLLWQNSVIRKVHTKFIDYSFRAGWFALASLGSFLLYQLHLVLK
jgi:hypothetical protein